MELRGLWAIKISAAFNSVNLAISAWHVFLSEIDNHCCTVVRVNYNSRIFWITSPSDESCPSLFSNPCLRWVAWIFKLYRWLPYCSLQISVNMSTRSCLHICYYLKCKVASPQREGCSCLVSCSSSCWCFNHICLLIFVFLWSSFDQLTLGFCFRRICSICCFSILFNINFSCILFWILIDFCGGCHYRDGCSADLSVH